jgi:hypothetical protein
MREFQEYLEDKARKMHALWTFFFGCFFLLTRQLAISPSRPQGKGKKNSERGDVRGIFRAAQA